MYMAKKSKKDKKKNKKSKKKKFRAGRQRSGDAPLPPARPTPGPGHDSAPGSVCSRGRAVAGAQVASRRKAQHGSSRTVVHEGCDLSPGDTSRTARGGQRDTPGGHSRRGRIF